MSSTDVGCDPELIREAVEASRNIQATFLGSGGILTENPSDLGVAGNIIEHAGEHAGKFDPPVSLSTHIINTVVTGLNAYVYDTIVRAGEEPNSEKALLLLGALSLHDVNKYVEQEYEPDFDVNGNSEAVIDYYFEQGDDFGIRELLPGDTEQAIEQDIKDVKWLIQRTETKEKSIETRMDATRRVRGLERYCRIGDSFVSKVGRDGLLEGVEWLENRYPPEDRNQINYLQFTTLEQPLLTNHLITVVKAIIGQDDILPDDVATGADPHGVLLGTTNNAVAYLGNPIDKKDLRSLVESTLMELINSEHDFDCKTEWRSFDPDILTEVDIGFEAKREIIIEGYSETLRQGSGTDHEFESIPEAYQDYLPELAHLVFNTQAFDEVFDGLEELPQLQDQVKESDEYNNQTWKIGFLAELLRRYRGVVNDGYHPETLDQELQTVRDRVQPVLADLLAVEADAGGAAIDRFFAGPQTEYEELGGSDKMCFLCGRRAETEYKKGRDAFYGTNKFSRRVPPEGQYKRICPVCNLEHALLKDHCETLDNRVGDETEIAFVFYDDFLAGIGVGQHVVYDLMDEEKGYDVADPELLANTFTPQFHLQPFFAAGQNQRLAAVRTILDDLVGSGLKVMIGKPFTTFRPVNALFVDLNPGRRQVVFGADRIASSDERKRASAFFDLLAQTAGASDSIDQRNAYISAGDDRFASVADLVVQHTDWYHNVRAQAHEYFNEHRDNEQYMMMQEVARSGLDLYGEQYDSRHKKTKIFREAIDATLDGLNREKDDEELREHVAGQVYKAAQTEKFAPRTTPEKAGTFVDTLFRFLESEESLTKAALSRRRNTLTNTYLFAYDQLLNERREKREQNA